MFISKWTRANKVRVFEKLEKRGSVFANKFLLRSIAPQKQKQECEIYKQEQTRKQYYWSPGFVQ